MKQLKVLVFGASGMLGHKVCQTMARTCEVFATIRSDEPSKFLTSILPGVQIVPGVYVERSEQVSTLLKQLRPDVVINCVGIVKQLAEAEDHISSITINALFPHLLAGECQRVGARLISLSTDCIFSGRKGMYSESDSPDPVDLYGRTKHLGEVSAPNTLTIRTSMIGRQLTGEHGLVEWFLTQPNSKINGYKKAVFSGLTTNALAEVICQVVLHHPELHGVLQLAAEPISKFDLLNLIKAAYKVDVQIDADTDFSCNRSLNGAKFLQLTGIAVPCWTDMITQMHSDPTPYKDRRRAHVN
jgi:dTDP-4-dehydrorhamnose reductase